jgi:hypothetical protein
VHDPLRGAGQEFFLGSAFRIEASNRRVAQVGDHPIEEARVDLLVRPAMSEQGSEVPVPAPAIVID